MVYTQIENHILNPVIMSKTVRISPLLVLISVLVGAEIGAWIGGLFGGFVAALLSIPAAGALQVIVSEAWRLSGPNPGTIPPLPVRRRRYGWGRRLLDKLLGRPERTAITVTVSETVTVTETMTMSETVTVEPSTAEHAMGPRVIIGGMPAAEETVAGGTVAEETDA
jgi:hypothetical protein